MCDPMVMCVWMCVNVCIINIVISLVCVCVCDGVRWTWAGTVFSIKCVSNNVCVRRGTKHTAKIRFRVCDNLNWQTQLDLGGSTHTHTHTHTHWTIDNTTSQFRYTINLHHTHNHLIILYTKTHRLFEEPEPEPDTTTRTRHSQNQRQNQSHTPHTQNRHQDGCIAHTTHMLTLSHTHRQYGVLVHIMVCVCHEIAHRHFYQLLVLLISQQVMYYLILCIQLRKIMQKTHTQFIMDTHTHNRHTHTHTHVCVCLLQIVHTHT